MKNLFKIVIVFSLIFAISCKEDKMTRPKIDVKPPVAEKTPKEFEEHGNKRVDNYYWMRLTDEQRSSENPDNHAQKVFDYLNAENAYYDTITAHTKDLKESLFQVVTIYPLKPGMSRRKRNSKGAFL